MRLIFNPHFVMIHKHKLIAAYKVMRYALQALDVIRVI